MPRPENHFEQIANVPVHYDRFSDSEHGYGTRGKPHTFHCEEPFEELLNEAFQELWEICPLGEAEVITSAGAYVDKPGMHGKGQAFDLDGLFWSDRSFVTKNYPDDRAFYLAVESVLRRHFGVVLNYEYNPSHHDHFHVSTKSETGFVPSHRSHVLYLQMALTHLFDTPVTIDGLIGPETNGAARDLLVELGLADSGDLTADSDLHEALNTHWSELLTQAAERGFEGAAREAERDDSPLDRLERIYALIDEELEEHPSRKKLETAVTSFAQHPETEEWLNTFREET